MAEKIFEVDNLNMVIKENNLLNAFSLKINKSERVGITGPSGCGKSTLIKSIISKKFPQGSTFKNVFYDYLINSSYIPQSHGLLPWYSLKKNLSIFSNDNAFTNKVVSMFNLQDILNNFPHQLSGGEYQRSMLANSLISNPDIYYADEPLTELDILNKWKLFLFWSEHIYNSQASLLLISHDIETLLYLCDRVIVLSDKPSFIIKELNINISHPRTIDFLVSDTFYQKKRELVYCINNEKSE